MPIEMQIFNHTINTLATAFLYFCLIVLLSGVVDHKKSLLKTFVIYAGLLFITFGMTEALVDASLKTMIEVVYLIFMYRLLLTRETAAVAMYVMLFWFVNVTQENLTILLCVSFNITPFVDVCGVRLGRWQVLVTSSIIMLLLSLGLKKSLNPFLGIVGKRGLWLLTFAGFIFFSLCQTIQIYFSQQVESQLFLVGIFSIIGLAVLGGMLYMFSSRAFYLEQKEKSERLRAEILEKQFMYYQEKQKDEEKVRAVYHDMKNHLLVLEQQFHSREREEMVEKLQREVEMYMDYVHTGNDFLDIIIKDKSRLAREKHIDLSVDADLKGMDFIEPLDISTIFGNGLDNAIEASEKLPEGQRVILVKAGRRRDFLSILMENNCRGEMKENGKRTGKKDDYLHGFGISNMKRAAEKYGGQLTVRCGDGRFTLNILIPIP